MTTFDDPALASSERSGGQSVRDHLGRDPIAPPESLWASTPRSFGIDDLSTDRYLSPEWHRREMEHMWPKVWQVACHEQEIAEVGDHFVYTVGTVSFLVARSASDEIKAYYNACLHRGTRLKTCAGNSEQIRCPFHGWTWRLDGALTHIPASWDFPQVKLEEFGLIEVRVDCWGGFVFVCPDSTALSLREWLDPLPEFFARVRYEDRQVVAHVRRVLPCNWKVAQEAFIETYHVSTTHPQNAMNLNDFDSQYDVLSDNVSRMITLVGVPGPSVDYDIEEQEILDSLADSGIVGADGEPLQLGDSPSARETLTEVTKTVWTHNSGLNADELAAYDLVDAVEYSVFPNFSPWAGLGVPFAYTFVPYGDDPDQSVWDIWVLWPKAEGTPLSPAPPVKELLGEEQYVSVPELSWIGHLFDQDLANMRRIQDGLKTLPKGVTFSAYQESRIRHHHERLEGYLVAGEKG